MKKLLNTQPSEHFNYYISLATALVKSKNKKNLIVFNPVQIFHIIMFLQNKKVNNLGEKKHAEN